MRFNPIPITVAAITLLQGVNAGAGAVINACLYVPNQPPEAFDVSFTAGSSADTCMNDEGTSASMTVNSTGVVCTSVGYVENKASGHCWGDFTESNWELSYTGGGFSGHTNTNWYNTGSVNAFDIIDSSPGVYACTSQELCTATTVNWNHGTQGPLYIIFIPATYVKRSPSRITRGQAVNREQN